MGKDSRHNACRCSCQGASGATRHPPSMLNVHMQVGAMDDEGLRTQQDPPADQCEALSHATES